MPALLYALSAICLLYQVQNPDLWWHLSAGRWILENGALPRADFLSHTRFGVPWVDFEWLLQVVYYLVYKTAGCWGLVGLRVVVLSAVLAAGSAVTALHGWGRRLQALTALWLAAALIPVADLRPDNVSLLFFALLVLALEARRLGRLRYDRRFWVVAACGFALWSNLHLAFLYGLILAGAYAAGDLAEAALPVVYGKGRWGKLDKTKDYVGLIGLGAAATLLNPYSGQLWGVLREHHDALRLLQEFICEWQIPDARQPSFRPFWGLLLTAYGCALAHFWKTRRTPLGPLIALFYFGLASSQHQRHLSYLSLAAVPVVALTAKDLLLPRWTPWAAGLLLAGHVLFSAAPNTLLADPSKPCLERGARLAEFLEKEKAALGGRRLYNQWGDGGYLGFRLAPDYKIYFDGRYIFHNVLFETKEAFRRPEDWARHVDLYGIEVALVRRLLSHGAPEKVGRKVVPRPYWVRYFPEKEWALVYWDDTDIIFVRRSAVDRTWIARREFRWVRPDDGAWLAALAERKKAPRKAVEAELRRAGLAR